jgi:Leucine-rich repeat (LRR) protein
MIRPGCLLLTLLLSGGCADYRFTVNERVVYTPTAIFSDFDIPDPALHACIEQHLTDASITAAEQLTELNCSHAGIANLQGLDVFAHLVRLKLSSNSIESLGALAELSGLRELHLDGNRLRNVMVLHGLLKLEHLDLRDNPALLCRHLDFFRQQPGIELVAPAQCQEGEA